MRTATLTIVALALVACASAQKLTLLPQLGIQNSKTSILYNAGKAFQPLGAQVSPALGLNLNYTIRRGHGIYMAVSSARTGLNFRFADPESGASQYQASTGKLNFALGAGYQYSSRPIFFKAGHSTTEKKTTAHSGRCSGMYSMCQRANKSIAPRNMPNKKSGWAMRIQPSLGMAFAGPGNGEITVPKTSGEMYKYAAGRWTSAISAGTGFAFEKNRQAAFTLRFDYLKGIGNLGDRTVTSASGVKTAVAQLSSRYSAWSITAGIPITLYSKQKAVRHQAPVQREHLYEKKCSGYHKCQRGL